MKHFYESIDGYFDFQDMYDKMISEQKDPAHFIEIGCWKGKSSAYMIVEIINSKKNIRFDAIDIFHSTMEEYKENLKPVLSSINLIKSDSTEAAKLYQDNTIDFVYLDTSHLYEQTINELQAWYPKIKTGGILGGHDYGHVDFSGLMKAIDEIFPDRKLLGNSSWYIRK